MKVFTAAFALFASSCVLLSCNLRPAQDCRPQTSSVLQRDLTGPSEALLRRASFMPDFLPGVLHEPEPDPCQSAEGRRPIRGKIDPRVIFAAGEQLNLPMGTGRALSVRGRRYIFCLEPHFHEKGSGAGPEGWHKGVTVYEATTSI